MSLTLDWLHIAILFGAAQGMLLAMALAARRENRVANRLMAALMAAFSVYLASNVYYAMGMVVTAPHFFGFSFPLPFLFGPLVYLYALTAADLRRGFIWPDVLHFAPFVAVIVAALPIYMMSGADKIALHNLLQTGTSPPPLIITVATPLKFVSGITYAVLTLAFLSRHREHVKDSYSTTERVNLAWLRWFAAIAAGIWTLALVVNVAQAVGEPLRAGEELISLAIAALVYGVGYRGLRQPEVLHLDASDTPPQVVEPPTDVPATTAAVIAPATANSGNDAITGAAPTPARYERSGLTDAGARKLKAKLLDVMEHQRPWTDSELTLADLAAALGTTPHRLSEVLNAEIGQTFYDFVNGYRVREVQRRIAAGEGKSLKLLALALDAGFASKSTFNQVFKKHTSQTPSAFQQAVGG